MLLIGCVVLLCGVALLLLRKPAAPDNLAAGAARAEAAAAPQPEARKAWAAGATATRDAPAQAAAPDHARPPAAHPLWPGATVMDFTESVAGPDGRMRRVTLLQPAELPYPVRIEEWLERGLSGGEWVLERREMVADRIMARPQPGREAEFLAAVAALGGTAQWIGQPGIFRVHLPEATLEAAPQAVAFLAAQTEAVRYAEPDAIVRLVAVPDDPYFADGSLWGLHNTGQNGGTAGADMPRRPAGKSAARPTA